MIRLVSSAINIISHFSKVTPSYQSSHCYTIPSFLSERDTSSSRSLTLQSAHVHTSIVLVVGCSVLTVAGPSRFCHCCFRLHRLFQYFVHLGVSSVLQGLLWSTSLQLFLPVPDEPFSGLINNTQVTYSVININTMA